MKLDRRLNILIYLNHGWLDVNGGHLELWNENMKKCEKKILPIFNRMVIFSTTDFSYHGNPNIVKIEKNSRKSIALYYYSNGRPNSERKLGLHSTIFRKRPGTEDVDANLEFKKIIGKIYLKSKKKYKHFWSGQRGSNPRPSRWQRDALPLSYARLAFVKAI